PSEKKWLDAAWTACARAGLPAALRQCATPLFSVQASAPDDVRAQRMQSAASASTTFFRYSRVIQSRIAAQTPKVFTRLTLRAQSGSRSKLSLQKIATICEGHDLPRPRACLAALGSQLRALKPQILEFDRRIIAWHRRRCPAASRSRIYVSSCVRRY